MEHDEIEFPEGLKQRLLHGAFFDKDDVIEICESLPADSVLRERFIEAAGGCYTKEERDLVAYGVNETIEELKFNNELTFDGLKFTSTALAVDEGVFHAMIWNTVQKPNEDNDYAASD